MDKVDDETRQTQTQTVKISFADDVSNLENGVVRVEQDAFKTQEDEDPDSMADWEQRTPAAAPYTTMQVDTGYLKKKPAAMKKLNKVIGTTLMVLAVIVVWILMSLPSLCHFQVICRNTPAPLEDATRMPENHNNCSMYRYENGICSPYLSSCSAGSTIHLTNIEKNATHESNLQKLFLVLTSQTVGASCSDESETVKQFICQYIYQPCYNMSQVYLPPRNICEHLRDDVCKSEWNILANNADFRTLLPNCNVLGNVSEPSCDEIEVSSGQQPPTSVLEPSTTPVTPVGCKAYTGSICTNHIQFCSNASVSASIDIQSIEGILASVSSQLQSQSALCAQNADIALNFLCLNFLKPCDDNGTVIQPNRSTCVLLRDQLCPTTWAAFSTFLPSCSNLNEAVIQPTCSATGSGNTTIVPSQPPTNTIISLNLTCNEDLGFVEINNTCQPLCSRWMLYSKLGGDIADGIVLTCALVGLLGAVAVFFFSVVRYERVLRFPTVFIVYMTVDLMILGVFVLVQYIDRFGLSCTSDDNLVNTIANSTPFCTASGFALYYVLIGLTWFWLVHVVSTFYKVMWPFHARQHESKLKYVHAVCLIIGIILPFGPALAAYFIDGFGNGRFPPLLCVGRNRDVNYYGVGLPVSLSVAVGMTLLIIILHVLQQKQRLFKYRENSKTYSFGLSAAEKKIILIFLYYIVLSSNNLISYTISSSFLNLFHDAITDNFLCESVRTDPDTTCPEEFHNYRVTEVLSLVTYCLVGLFPLVNLLFAINIEEVKVKFKKWCCNKKNSRSRTASTSLQNTPPDSPPFSLRRNKSYTLNTQPINTRQVGTVGKAGRFKTAVSE